MSDPEEGRLADAAHRLGVVAKRLAERVELCARHRLSGTDADGAGVRTVEHARRTGHGAALLRRPIGVSECRFDLGLREEGARVEGRSADRVIRLSEEGGGEYEHDHGRSHWASLMVDGGAVRAQLVVSFP